MKFSRIAWGRSVVLMQLCVASLLMAPLRATAQVDSGGIGNAPYSHMHMLLERTIFKVDVLELDVCFGDSTAAALESFGRRERSGALEDSIAYTAIAASRALGTIRFLRNISLDQFIDGVRDEQRKAVDAGLLDEATFRLIGDSLPVWFAFLEERGIRDGDRVSYDFTGDSVRTVYHDPDGNVLFDRVADGWQRRTSVIATWFAPGSGFRKPLLRSLGRPAGGATCGLPTRPSDLSGQPSPRTPASEATASTATPRRAPVRHRP